MQTDPLDKDDRYELRDLIDKGFLSMVYRGYDRKLRRIVVIKVLREIYSTNPQAIEWFQQEAQTVSGLPHPNIVQVYDYGQTNDKHYIVMQLIEGTNLRRYLRSRGVLPVDRAVIIAHDVALGLGAAHHRGIAHRKVNPVKILVGRDGSIRLTGFGMPLVDAQYYSPEQAEGETGNATTDVYSLGLVMYEMLTGRLPFDGDTPVAIAMQHIQDQPTPPSQLNPNIPPPLEAIIMRCLEKKPEKRFQDGGQLARALETLADGSEGGGGIMTNREANNLKIKNNEGAQRWEAHIDQYVAVAEYRRRGDTIFFIHTEVPREMEGQGVASRLVKTALDDARTQQLAVIPFCPFVAGYIQRHPDYKALVPAEFQDLVEDEAGD